MSNTEKNIKDYLHLYLGCEVQTPDCVGVNLGLYYTTIFGFFNGVNVRYPEGEIYVQNYNQVKPILRPLSDMTEEERNISGRYYDSEVWTAEGFKYLLSKHFDLFGLIDAGLAIDKITLK